MNKELNSTKIKKVKKKFSFDHADDDVSSYYLRGGCIQTVNSNMHFLIDEDRKKLNKIIEEFLKEAHFKKR